MSNGWAGSMRESRLVRSVAGVCVILLACGQHVHANTPLEASQVGLTPMPPVSSPDSVTQLTMRNVDFHTDSTGFLRIRRLEGTMRSRVQGAVVDFDDPRSFEVTLSSGEVALTGADLTHLMTAYIFNYQGSPLSKLAARIEGGRLVLTGTLHKGVDLPFELSATVGVGPNGRLRIHANDIHAEHINAGGLLHALHLSLASLLDLSGSKGATAVDDDILIEPLRALPPPTLRGTLVDARIADAMLVLGFGASAAPIRAADSASNYLRLSGGSVRFGRLVMNDADITMTDADPRDPFDFFLDRYQRQLVAGYSRTLANGGLIVVMPDFAKLSSARVVPPTRGADNPPSVRDEIRGAGQRSAASEHTPVCPASSPAVESCSTGSRRS